MTKSCLLSGRSGCWTCNRLTSRRHHDRKTEGLHRLDILGGRCVCVPLGSNTTIQRRNCQGEVCYTLDASSCRASRLSWTIAFHLLTPQISAALQVAQIWHTPHQQAPTMTHTAPTQRNWWNVDSVRVAAGLCRCAKGCRDSPDLGRFVLTLQKSLVRSQYRPRLGSLVIVGRLIV